MPSLQQELFLDAEELFSLSSLATSRPRVRYELLVLWHQQKRSANTIERAAGLATTEGNGNFNRTQRGNNQEQEIIMELNNMPFLWANPTSLDRRLEVEMLDSIIARAVRHQVIVLLQALRLKLQEQH